MPRADRNSERGQATLEAVVAVAVVAPMMAFAVQAGWAIHCANALDAAIEHAKLSVGPADAAEGDAAAATIEGLILEAAPELGAGTMTVEQAEIAYEATPDVSEDLPDEEFEAYRVATKNSAGGNIAVRAKVTYAPMRLLPVMEDGPLVRTVDSTRAYDAQFELG